MPTNPYEPPPEESERCLPPMWRHVRDAVIVGAGAIVGAYLCMPVVMSTTKPTVTPFILAWLQSAAGAIVGGLIFSWSARYIHRPKT